MAQTLSILFVCMGNICRSPMAEGVFRARIAEAGLTDRVRVDSAGTIDYHAGERPDRRAMDAARRRGYALDDLRARGLTREDCARFDLVLAMDRGNLNRIRRSCDGAAEVRLFLDFAPDRAEQEVPDPYGGGPDGFEYVLDLIEVGVDGLLADVRRRLEAQA